MKNSDCRKTITVSKEVNKNMEKKILGIWTIVLIIALSALGISLVNYMKAPEQDAGIEITTGTGNTSALHHC